jgi:hypothetical protein
LGSVGEETGECRPDRWCHAVAATGFPLATSSA